LEAEGPKKNVSKQMLALAGYQNWALYVWLQRKADRGSSRIPRREPHGLVRCDGAFHNGQSGPPELGEELTNSFCRTDPEIAKAFACA
jgi:hypothetical protein